MKRTLLIAATAVTVLGRFLIVPRLNLPTSEGCYESFAHLFVGGLFGAWAGCRKWQYLAIGVLLSLFELVMFLAQKGCSGG